MPEPRLKLVPPKDRQVIATAVSIVVGVSDDRQMTFQTGFQGDETPEDINRRFDGMMALADRQRAKYKLITARKDLKKLERTFSDFLEDKARVEARHIKDQADRAVQIDELRRLRDDERKKAAAEMDAEILRIQEARVEEWNAGVEDARRHGKLGGYKPVGARAATLDRIDRALAKLKDVRDESLEKWEQDYDAKIAGLEAEIHRADEDRTQHANSLTTSIERYKENIAAAKEEIEEFEGVIGG